MRFRSVHSDKFFNYSTDKFEINWGRAVTRGGANNFGKFQFRVKRFLYNYWKEDYVCEEFIIPKSNGKSIDFLNLTKRICVEAQGEFHHEVSFVHKNKYDFLKQLYNDDFKETWCTHNNITYVEIYPEDELNKELAMRLGITFIN